MITREEVVGLQALPIELEPKLAALLESLNLLRKEYGKPMRVTSGYRTPERNARVGGAKGSLHMQALACDFADQDGSLARWCLNNLDALDRAGLYLEDPGYTPGWVHVQAKPPKSGKRVFKP